MTDWEKAIAHWLPSEWRPGQHCKGAFKKNGDKYWNICPHGHMAGHDIPCPPLSCDLGFRLLEAMLKRCDRARVSLSHDRGEFGARVAHLGALMKFDPDLLTAITKAAAALAEREQP